VGSASFDRGGAGRLARRLRRGGVAGAAHVHRLLRWPGQGGLLLPGGRARRRSVAARRVPRAR
jgi:hypothetical protein